ncbi:hypothetical protein NCAS_0A14740 [Naumovozyma castellii]|uniref:V-type proton ATPase subunit H n=1 Tax=Naumovozyma castellii TaxID=27288 RepID=G0V982_NAUCA|nr:hypothetical protein NCAS_0A14740 [Naumovozyma castellii CBS 4309]CCC68032.1 hypothetical protein NCAS_0A14740 [Naumovozyma castellii CBS 4309]
MTMDAKTNNTTILLDSTHFNEIRGAIRSRTVAWDALARSGEISELDASVAKKLETILIKENAPDGVAENLIIDESVVLPLIHLMAHAMENDSESKFEILKSVQNLFVELFCSASFCDGTIEFFVQNPDQLDALFKVSLVGDVQTVLISAFNLVTLLIQPELIEKKKVSNIKMVDELLGNKDFMGILKGYERTDTCYVCIRLIQELMGVKQYRSTIWSHEADIVPVLFIILKRAINDSNSMNNNNSSSNNNGHSPRLVATSSNNLGIQIQYYSLLLIWLMTFNSTWANEFVNKYLSDFLNLLKLVKITIKEKISRLSISIILQCCSTNVKGHKSIIKNLILLGNGIPTLQSLSERKYSDEELREDIITLKELLEEEYQELTSFDEYVAELDSKLLCWSPPHIDNGFWSDNIDSFKENGWKLFKKLVNLLIEISADHEDLNTRQNKLILQVVLNDITHVIELLPESVDVLNKMNGKVVIMELLNHSDSRVKFEALKATQAMIGYTLR